MEGGVCICGTQPGCPCWIGELDCCWLLGLNSLPWKKLLPPS
ncbi:hypothetical protein [Lysobacter gummosus]